MKARPSLARDSLDMRTIARSWPSSAVVLWALLGAGTSSLHAPQPFGVGPPPAWVERLAVDTQQETPSNQVSAGVYYLLAEHQVRVGASSVEAYHHVARKIINDAGLGNGAELNIQFDPAFQGMRIHFLRILRGK